MEIKGLSVNMESKSLLSQNEESRKLNPALQEQDESSLLSCKANWAQQEAKAAVVTSKNSVLILNTR